MVSERERRSGCGAREQSFEIRSARHSAATSDWAVAKGLRTFSRASSIRTRVPDVATKAAANLALNDEAEACETSARPESDNPQRWLLSLQPRRSLFTRRVRQHSTKHQLQLLRLSLSTTNTQPDSNQHDLTNRTQPVGNHPGRRSARVQHLRLPMGYEPSSRDLSHLSRRPSMGAGRWKCVDVTEEAERLWKTHRVQG